MLLVIINLFLATIIGFSHDNQNGFEIFHNDRWCYYFVVKIIFAHLIDREQDVALW